ncbi:MAG: cytochrome c3 family protein, partial [Armatimonadota bacterium]
MRRLLITVVCSTVMTAPAVRAFTRFDAGTCGICHADEKVAFAESAHEGIGMTCTDCHGGDPTDTEITSMSPKKGFRGSPDHRSVPQFCAGCHADRARMRQYGLPTTQFEDYQTSRHGMLWARGDENVPVCTDCHGVHDILPTDDPRSHVYPANVPKTCARCHSDETLMRRYRLPADPYDKFAQSVNGRRLLQGDVKAVPSCATCHGSHGALPPGVQEIGNVCGQCHAMERDLVNDSPHGKATAEGKMSECVSCHGHHEIQAPPLDEMGSLCGKCHDPESSALQVGQRMLTLIQEAKDRLDEAQDALKVIEEQGEDTSRLKAMLEEAHTEFVQTARAQHGLDPDLVERHTVVAAATGQNVLDQTEQFHQRRSVRRMGLTVALV